MRFVRVLSTDRERRSSSTRPLGEHTTIRRSPPNLAAGRRRRFADLHCRHLYRVKIAILRPLHTLRSTNLYPVKIAIQPWN